MLAQQVSPKRTADELRHLSDEGQDGQASPASIDIHAGAAKKVSARHVTTFLMQADVDVLARFSQCGTAMLIPAFLPSVYGTDLLG